MFRSARFGTENLKPATRVQGIRGGAALNQTVGTIQSSLGGLGLLGEHFGTVEEVVRADFELLCQVILKSPLKQPYLAKREARRARHSGSKEDEVDGEK